MDWLRTLPPVIGSTINFIPLPGRVAALIYLIALAVFAAGTAAFLRKGLGPREAAAKGMALAFLASGLAFALHSDLGWAAWVAADHRRFAGLGLEERLLRVDGALYDLTRHARRRGLSKDYALAGGHRYARLRVEYLLLPLRRRERSEHVLVLGDPSRCGLRGFEPVLLHPAGCLLRKE